MLQEEPGQLPYRRHETGLVRNETAYWQRVLAAAFSELPRRVGTSGSPVQVEARLSEAATAALRGEANLAYGTEPRDLMLLALALGELHHGERTLIALEGASRFPFALSSPNFRTLR